VIGPGGSSTAFSLDINESNVAIDEPGRGRRRSADAARSHCSDRALLGDGCHQLVRKISPLTSRPGVSLLQYADVLELPQQFERRRSCDAQIVLDRARGHDRGFADEVDEDQRIARRKRRRGAPIALTQPDDGLRSPDGVGRLGVHGREDSSIQGSTSPRSRAICRAW
jgi:hypothetical protein